MGALKDAQQLIDRVLAGDFDDASPDEREAAVDRIVQWSALAAGAVALQPLPLLDVLLLSPIQIAMVQAIGRIHGQRLDEKSVLEVLSTFGASILAQNVILSTAKFVPFIGWATSIAMAYALTWAVGEVADYYFGSGRGASKSELKARFDEVYRRKKAEKMKDVGSNKESLKARLAQLQEALDAGLLTPEEFDVKRRDVLASL